MLMTVDNRNRGLFETACAFERIAGSRCLNSFECLDPRPDTRFLLQQRITGEPAAALYLSGKRLLISAGELAEPDEVAEFIGRGGVTEIEAGLEFATELQRILDARMDTFRRMAHVGGVPSQTDLSAVQPGRSEDVFMVLQQCPESGFSRLRFGAWAADVRLRQWYGKMELCQVSLDDEPVGAGMIASQDSECCVLAAVGVVPEHRGKGFGRMISQHLIRRVLELGKTPRALCDPEPSAAFFRKLGFRDAGSQGRLYR